MISELYIAPRTQRRLAWLQWRTNAARWLRTLPARLATLPGTQHRRVALYRAALRRVAGQRDQARQERDAALYRLAQAERAFAALQAEALRAVAEQQAEARQALGEANEAHALSLAVARQAAPLALVDLARVTTARWKPETIQRAALRAAAGRTRDGLQVATALHVVAERRTLEGLAA